MAAVSALGASAARRLLGLLALVVTVTALLFVLLRAAGDPAIMLAGAEATPEQVAEIRAAYGLDRSMLEQFLAYVGALLRLDFGRSLATGEPALAMVVESLGPTLMLAGGALAAALFIAIPLGAWLGAGGGAARGLAAGVLFVLQGTPGFVAALLLIQLFSIELGVLPSFGLSGPASWVLPVATLTAFLAPQQARLVAADMADAMASDYVRTARATGAGAASVVLRHALPNALLGVIGLAGAQAAFLASGAVVTETIFGWPGLGALLIASTQTLDFPVLQTIAIVVSVIVFSAGSLAEAVARLVDPRLRVQGGAP
jgi:peptide/nickel transport system permease protein